MLNTAEWPDRRWVIGAIAVVLAVTLWRVGWLAASKAELGVDEAQYWLWSRALDWGYFSKPPMIAWIIRATTDVLGTDSPFAVRLSAPLLQGATVLLVLWFGWLIGGRRIGLLAGAAYLTMPVLTIGSMTMSTDTPMLFFLAASLVAWLRLVHGPSMIRAAGLGLMIGAAVLSKYAMVFILPGMVLAAVSVPGWQMPRREGWIAGIVALVVVGPNIWWNYSHGFATLHHLADSAGWSGMRLYPAEVSGFLLSQFAVFGPVFFAVMLWQSLLVLFGGGNPALRGAVLLCLPVLVVVTGQALLSHAYANWAVAAAAGGSLVAALALQKTPRLLAATLVLQGTLTLALPPLPAVAIGLQLPNGQLLFKRYLGRADLAQFALDLAQANRLPAIVAAERPLLADLFYQARDSQTRVYATPPDGAPANHYAMAYPLPAQLPGDVLLYVDAATAERVLSSYPGARELGRISPTEGWAIGRSFVALRIAAAYWTAATAAGGALSLHRRTSADSG